jgi:antitoxin PrlF
MASQAVTAKGQITLKRDLLQHLGIRPGERVDLEKMSGGELRLRAARSTGTIDGFLGVLAGKTKKMDAAAAADCVFAVGGEDVAALADLGQQPRLWPQETAGPSIRA